jgi:hypothetical protein
VVSVSVSEIEVEASSLLLVTQIADLVEKEMPSGLPSLALVRPTAGRVEMQSGLPSLLLVTHSAGVAMQIHLLSLQREMVSGPSSTFQNNVETPLSQDGYGVPGPNKKR